MKRGLQLIKRIFQKDKKLSKKFLLTFLLASFLVVGIGFLATELVYAQDTADPVDVSSLSGAGAYGGGVIGKVIVRLVGGLVLALIHFVGFILSRLIEVLFWIIEYNDFVVAKPVLIGWEIVRDLSNQFFSLILLAIAIGTILRVESYNVKKMLPKVIVMAVLVNFSLLISGLLIDAAQVVMMTFAAGYKDSPGNLVALFNIADFVTGAGSQVGNNADTIEVGLLTSLILALVLMVVATITTLVMVVVMIMRVVMLWVLVILSPLAYIMAAFPQGQKYAQQWWQDFTKYLIIGPVFAFFLFLSFAIANSSGQIDHTTLGEGVPAINSSGESAENVSTLTAIAHPDALMGFIIAIALLMGSLMVTQQLGVAGAGFAGNMYGRVRGAGIWAATRPGSWGWKGVKGGAGWVNRKQGVKTGLDLNPVNFFRGIGKSFEEKKQRDIVLRQNVAGKALEKGGIGGILRGTGAPQDWANAYIQGFGNWSGFRNMYRSVRGGNGAVEEIQRDYEFKKRQADEAQSKAKMRREALGMTDQERENKYRDVFVEDNLEAKVADISAKRKAGFNSGQYNTILDKDGNNVFIDDAMEDAGIVFGNNTDPSDLRRDGRFKEAEEKEKFLSQWDEQIAKKELSEEADTKVTQANSGNTTARTEINDTLKTFFEKQSKEAEIESKSILSGNLPKAEYDANNKRLANIMQEIKFLLSKKASTTNEADKDSIQLTVDTLRSEASKIGNKTGADTWDARRVAANIEERTANYAKAKEKELESERLGLLAGSFDWNPSDRSKFNKEASSYESISSEYALEAEALKNKKESYIPPRAFYANREFRALQNEERQKITSENDAELLADLRQALRDGDSVKGIALTKKLASDGNLNEVLNGFGFSSDFKGFNSFMDAVFMGEKNVKRADGTNYAGPTFNMDKQTALAVQNDLSFTAESVNHWEMARSIDVKDGKFERMSEEDHARASYAEMLKKNPRESARNFNRLAYGGEVPQADGSRKFQMSLLGLIFAKGMGHELAVQFKGTESNKNAAKNLGMEIERLKAYGVDQDLIDSIKEKSKTLRSDNNHDVIEDLIKKYRERGGA